MIYTEQMAGKLPV